MPYYQCPECGFKQKSEAVDRIECHRCGRSYKRRKAKVVDKTPEDGEDGFFKYSVKEEG